MSATGGQKRKRAKRKPAKKVSKATAAKASAKVKANAGKPKGDPLKAYDKALAELNKQYDRAPRKGDGTAETDKRARFRVDSVPLSGEVMSKIRTWVPTFILPVDFLLGGGIPTGKVLELYGPQHIGKSTILYHALAGVQQLGGVGILADPESDADEEYMRKLGVDADALRYLNFPRGQMSLEAILRVIFDTADFWTDNYPDLPVLIGLDALGGTATAKELEKGIGQRVVAAAASVMRSACRLAPNHISGTNVGLIICNHEYEAGIGQGGRTWRETYGGGGLRHVSSMRVSLFPAGTIKTSDGTILGREVSLTLEKSRHGRKGRIHLAVLDDEGVSNVWSLYQEFVRRGIIAVAGPWSAMNLDSEELKFQGWRGLQRKVAELPDLWPRLVSVYQEATKDANLYL